MQNHKKICMCIALMRIKNFIKQFMRKITNSGQSFEQNILEKTHEFCQEVLGEKCQILLIGHKKRLEILSRSYIKNRKFFEQVQKINYERINYEINYERNFMKLF